MAKNFIIVGFVLVAFHLAGVAALDMYDALARYVALNRLTLVGCGILLAALLAGASMLFSGAGFYNVLFAVAKIFYEMSQFAICGLTLLSVVFWFTIGENIWWSFGSTVGVVLYGMLISAAFSLRLFDFNYPIKETLMNYAVLPLAALVIITVGNVVM